MFPSSDYQQQLYTTVVNPFTQEKKNYTMTMFVQSSHSRLDDFEHYFMDNPFIRLCFSRYNLADSLLESIFTLNCI